MREPLSITNTESQLVETIEQTEAVSFDSSPFRVLLLGDWSGRANRRTNASTDELMSYQPLFVDRDNLENLLSQLGARLSLQVTNGDEPLLIEFRQLDDFHPDSLFRRLDVFDSLRRLRARLQNPKTFTDAAVEVRSWLSKDTTSEQRDSSAKFETPRNNFLDQILSQAEDTASSSKLSQPNPEISQDVSQFARDVAQPYASPAFDPDEEQLIAAVDERISSTLTAIIHHPDFQKLESSWRALDFLVRRLDTGEDLKLYLLDVSLDELRADLETSEEFRASALYNIVVEQAIGTPGGLPWGLVAGNYTLDFAGADQSLLESIVKIAQEAQAPFVAGVTSHFLGCTSLASNPEPNNWNLPIEKKTEEWWTEVTSLPGAAYVGLSLPRFLIRLPYGEDTVPAEEFRFEEIPVAADEDSRHEMYLWANSAFAVVYVIARAFSDEEGVNRSDQLNIGGLPLHVYQRAGETQIEPCAEVLLTVRAAERILDRGFMPLLSMKNSDVMRLGMLQSIARSPLGGTWLRKSVR